MSSGKEFFAMKNFYKISIVLFVLINSSCAIQNPISAQQGYENNQVFYDQLSPYGEWVDYPDYGYVWYPDVDQDFSPYSTSGYWVMTDYGWTWVSDYPWGWAPFHYGRWDYDNNNGWFWVPDNEWGPSWVTWRTGNGYYGWTPMRPGISISLSFGNNYRDLDRWNFVRDRDFGRTDMHNYYAKRSDYNTIIVNSTVINNTYIDRSRNNTTYISGPSINDVQRVTGRKISNYAVRDNDRPGQTLKNSQLQIYRPQIQRTNNESRKPAPSRITNLKDVKPSRERNAPDQQRNVSPTENNRRVPQQTQTQQQLQEKRNKEQQVIQQKDQQRQVQQKQQQERRNQEQQTKQQNDQQRQVQQQQQQEKRNQEQQVIQQKDQQRQVQQKQQQDRRNQEQQTKQQNDQQRQVQQKQQQEQKQTRKSQPVKKQQSTDPAEKKRRE